jgi:hypothetical protein
MRREAGRGRAPVADEEPGEDCGADTVLARRAAADDVGDTSRASSDLPRRSASRACRGQHFPEAPNLENLHPSALLQKSASLSPQASQ